MTSTADELEAIRQLKARYCRYLDTRDVPTGGADCSRPI